MQDTYPPRCDGLDIDGWSWQHLAHKTAHGASWGRYVLVGTYDGKRFRLTEPARPDDLKTAPRTTTRWDATSACTPPPGGWAVVDRATATDAGLYAAIARAEKHPGYRDKRIEGSANVYTNTVEVTLYVADAAREHELDQRYGPRVVQLFGTFQPLD